MKNCKENHSFIFLDVSCGTNCSCGQQYWFVFIAIQLVLYNICCFTEKITHAMLGDFLKISKRTDSKQHSHVCINHQFFFFQISQKYIYRSSTILFLFNIFKVWKYNTLIKNKYIDLVIPNIVFLLKWVLDMYSYQFLKIIRSYWHYQITVDWISSCIRCCGWNIFLIILATFIPE